MMSEPMARSSRTQVDTIREEFTKTRKELEDSLYVNNKLKNDRSMLLTRNLELEAEFNVFKKDVTDHL
jgi:hypothetical protein